jgi:hypothetical protein
MRLRLAAGLTLVGALVFASGATPADPPPRVGHIGGIVPSIAARAEAKMTGGLGSGNLSYHGGPVMRTNTTYAIYWIPPGYSVSANYRSLINGFFQNVAAANGSTTNVYSIATEYSDTTGPIAYHSAFGGALVDTQPFPASGCSDAGLPVCLTDAQLQAEIDRVIGVKGWSAGNTHQFFMFTPKTVGSCFDSGSTICAYSYYCAYHGDFTSSHGHGTIVYANHPYTSATGAPSGCDIGQRPNGDDADPTINVVSHEHNEAITDPLLTAWYDASGYEDGDKCAWDFGGPLGATGGANTSYNEQIGPGKYYLQQEWSNKTSDPTTGSLGTCLERYAPVVVLTGTGAGTVTSSPAGISCTANPCDLSPKVGTQITLTAAPKAGSTFDRWSGDCAGTGACIVTVSAATSIRARFRGSGSPFGWTQTALPPPASRDPLPTGSYPDASSFRMSISQDGTARAVTVYDARVLQQNGTVHCDYDTTDTGGVFMQRKTNSGWVADGTITAPPVYSSSESPGAPGGSRWPNCGDFGRTTKLSGDGNTVLIAQPPQIVSGVPNDFRCVAFVYRRSSGAWHLDGTLFTPGVDRDGTGSTDGSACHAFGTGGAINTLGTRVAVLGQRLNGGTTADVYARQGGSWGLEQHIETPGGTDCATGVEPGNIALSGDGATLMLGDEDCDSQGHQVVGRVYVYKRTVTTWSLAQTIESPEPQFQNEFGRSIAISSDASTATIGVLQSTGLPQFAGAAWVFAHAADGWHSKVRLTEPTPGDRAVFGCPAPVRRGARIFCTAYNATVGYNSLEGALYSFDKPSSGWGPGVVPKRAYITNGYPLDTLGETGAAASEDGGLVDLAIDARTIANGDYAHDRVGFELKVPAAPLVSGFSPSSGAVGATVSVTGLAFTGATAVKFNGTSASFTVVSPSQITTTVPSAATTGPITVTNTHGSSTSAKSFTVS